MSVEESIIQALASLGEVELPRSFLRVTKVLSVKVPVEIHYLIGKAARKLGYRTVSDYVRTLICYDLLKQGLLSEEDFHELCFLRSPQPQEP